MAVHRMPNIRIRLADFENVQSLAAENGTDYVDMIGAMIDFWSRLADEYSSLQTEIIASRRTAKHAADRRRYNGRRAAQPDRVASMGQTMQIEKRKIKRFLEKERAR